MTPGVFLARPAGRTSLNRRSEPLNSAVEFCPAGRCCCCPTPTRVIFLASREAPTKLSAFATTTSPSEHSGASRLGTTLHLDSRYPSKIKGDQGPRSVTEIAGPGRVQSGRLKNLRHIGDPGGQASGRHRVGLENRTQTGPEISETGYRIGPVFAAGNLSQSMGRANRYLTEQAGIHTLQ